MKVLELLDAPPPHAPYRRLPIPDAGLRIGGPGCDVEVQAIQGSCRMMVVGGQPTPRPQGVCVAVPYPAGVFELQLSLTTVWVRVVDEAVPAAGWPEHPACAAADAGAPGPGAVQVLVDALLEAGHPFGEALSTAGDKRVALAHYAVLRDFGELELDWEGGLVDRVVLRGGTRGLRGFARHALLHLVREVDLIAFDPVDALNALSAGPLPWLERLTVHHVESKRLRGIEKKARALFPRARVELLPQRRLGLETRKQVEELPADRAIVLDARPAAEGDLRVIDRFVRWSGNVPVLGLAHGELVLNGRALVRPPHVPTWGVPLKVGDVFSVDGLERKVVAYQ